MGGGLCICGDLQTVTVVRHIPQRELRRSGQQISCACTPVLYHKDCVVLESDPFSQLSCCKLAMCNDMLVDAGTRRPLIQVILYMKFIYQFR